MEKFSDFNLPEVLAKSLERMKFTTPTPIQAQAIPPALEGRDVLGSAQTGTGKTASFMIPLVTHLLNNKHAKGLVMAPTRELAMQVLTMTQELLGPKSSIRTALLIGGDPMFKQFKQLGENPRLIIGTPGRINDHIRRKKSLLQETDFLVLDEADRMLDMGFSIQIDEVIKNMAEERQTLMFSATFSKEIINFTKRYLKNPVRVEISPEKISADKIKHDVVKTTSAEKFKRLTEELSTREGSIIIFVKTRVNADQIATRLCNVQDQDFRAEPIHGDLRQRQRERTIQGFRNKKFRILVATDVAARGLDIPHIEHVINYDLPQSPEDYVHRIGRTARAGAEGHAMAFVTPQDNSKWYAILRLVFPEQAAAEKKGRPELSKTKSRMRRRSERDRDFGGGSSEYSSSGVKPLFSSRKNEGKRNEDGSKNRWGKDRRDEGGRSSGPKRFGQKRSEGRFEEKSERNFNDRSEGRSEGNRSDGNRFDRDSEGRFEKRSEGRSGNRPERSEGRFEGRRSERGSEGRFEGKRERSFGDRPQRSDRSEGRSERSFGEKKFGARSEGRPERKFGDRPERKERSEGRYEGKRERNFNDPSDGRGRRSSESRSDRPARSGNRSDRPAREGRPERGSESERRYGSFSKDRSEGGRSEGARTGGKFFSSRKNTEQANDRGSEKSFEEKREYVQRKRSS